MTYVVTERYSTTMWRTEEIGASSRPSTDRTSVVAGNISIIKAIDHRLLAGVGQIPSCGCHVTDRVGL